MTFNMTNRENERTNEPEGWKAMKITKSLGLALSTTLALSLAACGNDAGSGDEAPLEADTAVHDCSQAAAEGGDELSRRSCEAGKPLRSDGVAANDDDQVTIDRSSDPSENVSKSVRTYTGACTGIWYGCSRVVAEGWQYTVCGSSLYTFMNFDGPYGNLVSWGIGYCWF
jgi:hypothetical protein